MWTLSWRHKSEVTGQENKRLQDQTHWPREMQEVKNNFDLGDKKGQSISERSNVTLCFLVSTTVAGATSSTTCQRRCPREEGCLMRSMESQKVSQKRTAVSTLHNKRM